MSLQWDPLARIKTAFRSRESVTPKMRTGEADGMKKPTPPSKGPPPLPKMAASPLAAAWIPTPRPSNSTPIEQLFFQEGVDGHAESVPPSGRTPCAVALVGTDSPAGAEAESTRAGRTTIPPMSMDDEWLDVDEDVEDPARTRRRRAAQIGTAWGTVVVLAAAAVAMVVSPRREVRPAAATASPSPVETAIAPAAVATPTPALLSPPVSAPIPVSAASVSAPVAASASPAICRSGMTPLAGGHTACVDVAESFLCPRDRRAHASRPVGCIDAKTPKAACESRGARLATPAERLQLAAVKGKTAVGAFRCVAAK